MRIAIIILTLLFSIPGISQYTLRMVAIDGENRDSVYTNASGDSLFKKVGDNYTFKSKVTVQYYTAANRVVGAGASGDMRAVNNLSEVNPSTARTNLGLVIGTNVLAPNGSAANLTNFPTLNQNTTGTAGGLSANIPQSRVTNLESDLTGKAPLASPTFTGNVTNTGTVTTTGNGIGYASGAGATVTQATNKTTGVIINKPCGQITMNNAALTAGSEAAFTVTNNTVAVTDVVIVNVQSVGTAGSYLVSVGAVANGSFSITLSNASGGSLSQAVVINFCVIKGANN